MIYQVVAVRDCVHEEYQGINLEISVPSAIRNFSSAVLTSKAKETGLLFTNPKDFSLWKIGEWDSESGSYVSVQPERLIEGGEVHA